MSFISRHTNNSITERLRKKKKEHIFVGIFLQVFNNNSFIYKRDDNYVIREGYEELYSRIINLGFVPSPNNTKAAYYIFKYVSLFFDTFAEEEAYWNFNNIQIIVREALKLFSSFSISEKENLSEIISQFIFSFVEFNYFRNYPLSTQPKSLSTSQLQKIIKEEIIKNSV